MPNLAQFEKQQYINVETFRKNGVGVKTPVWFVQDGSTLFVWTDTGTGKAKRIRNNSKILIAPCESNGKLLGDWMPATASVDDSDAAVQRLSGMMGKKYGFMYTLFGLLGRMRKSKYTCIKIQAA
jgi:PPOX class probable F420-dependent enzyme